MQLLYALVFGCTLVMVSSDMPQSTYPTKYDDYNPDDILKNDRLFNQYFICLTKKKGCTTAGELLSAIIPDALATSCAKCSAKQKAIGEKVIRFLYFNKPDEFAEMSKIYDPEGKYLEMYIASGGLI
uniref:Chemosensory protein 3 n=1 Tax=Sogatella furcifera TaxID=113103 RepID=A0A096W1I6_SOGFU|nr:chemosensory protein 3 [Sogatella furcifera]